MLVKIGWVGVLLCGARTCSAQSGTPGISADSNGNVAIRVPVGQSVGVSVHACKIFQRKPLGDIARRLQLSGDSCAGMYAYMHACMPWHL